MTLNENLWTTINCFRFLLRILYPIPSGSVLMRLHDYGLLYSFTDLHHHYSVPCAQHGSERESSDTRMMDRISMSHTPSHLLWPADRYESNSHGQSTGHRLENKEVEPTSWK